MSQDLCTEMKRYRDKREVIRVDGDPEIGPTEGLCKDGTE